MQIFGEVLEFYHTRVKQRDQHWYSCSAYARLLSTVLYYRGIFVHIFCLISISPSFSNLSAKKSLLSIGSPLHNELPLKL